MPPVLNDETTNGISIQITKCIANQLARYEYDIHFKDNNNFSTKRKKEIKEKLIKDWTQSIGKEMIFDVSILEVINLNCE